MNPNQMDQIVNLALREDRAREDITTKSLVGRLDVSTADIIVKEDAVVCGLIVAKRVFQKLDGTIRFHPFCRDGQRVKKNTTIVSIRGKTRALLAGERVALNLLGHLSGIATTAYRFVRAVAPYRVQILDTRKTTPGLRDLEKYAVRCGGGWNHRRDLSEMVLIKDNHRLVLKDGKKTLREMIVHLKKTVKKLIEVEVDDLNEFIQVLAARPDMILLDNMNEDQIRTAVRLRKKIKGRGIPLLEASGGITFQNVRRIARTGVDRISIGALTHSHKSIDISMELRHSR